MQLLPPHDDATQSAHIVELESSIRAAREQLKQQDTELTLLRSRVEEQVNNCSHTHTHTFTHSLSLSLSLSD